MSPLSSASRLRKVAPAVVAVGALTIGVMAPTASAIEPTWVVPTTAISTPDQGFPLPMSGTGCPSGSSILLGLFVGPHDPTWVWRDDINNQPAGLGPSALPESDGTWSTSYSVPAGLEAGDYTMTGECTTDPTNGSTGFYYGNVIV